jgi:hypothetical protein
LTYLPPFPFVRIDLLQRGDFWGFRPDNISYYTSAPDFFQSVLLIGPPGIRGAHFVESVFNSIVRDSVRILFGNPFDFYNSPRIFDYTVFDRIGFPDSVRLELFRSLDQLKFPK